MKTQRSQGNLTNMGLRCIGVFAKLKVTTRSEDVQTRIMQALRKKRNKLAAHQIRLPHQPSLLLKLNPLLQLKKIMSLPSQQERAEQ